MSNTKRNNTKNDSEKSGMTCVLSYHDLKLSAGHAGTIDPGTTDYVGYRCTPAHQKGPINIDYAERVGDKLRVHTSGSGSMRGVILELFS